MICRSSPRRPDRRRPKECSALVCHEIAGGPLREKSLDKPFAILVLCAYCNQYEVEDKAKWPQARQLALLMDKAPSHYNLAAFNRLVNPNAPNRITQEEVDRYRDKKRIQHNEAQRNGFDVVRPAAAA